MPELKLAKPHYIYGWCAMVSAVCYPDKPEKHDFFFKGMKGLVETLFVVIGFLKPPREDLQEFTANALEAGRFELSLDHEPVDRGDGRLWAIRILKTALSIHFDSEHEPSLNKVYDILMRRYGKNGRGDRTLVTHWSNYKSVAPILLAVHYNLERADSLFKPLKLEAGTSISDSLSSERLRGIGPRVKLTILVVLFAAVTISKNLGPIYLLDLNLI